MSETFSTFLWNLMIISCELFIFPSAFVSYYRYYVLGHSERSFQLIVPAEYVSSIGIFFRFLWLMNFSLKFCRNFCFFFRFAWNWRTPVGFFAACCLQCYWIHCVIIMIIGTISLFAKFCTLLGAMAKDLAWQFDTFSKAIIEARQQLTNGKSAQMKLKLIEIIEFHSVTQLYEHIYLVLNSSFRFFPYIALMSLIWNLIHDMTSFSLHENDQIFNKEYSFSLQIGGSIFGLF